jgi:tyrosinase
LSRGLRRTLAADPLPTSEDVKASLDAIPYDDEPRDRSPSSLRGRLEGWRPCGMHNKVHAWIGGDITPATHPGRNRQP